MWMNFKKTVVVFLGLALIACGSDEKEAGQSERDKGDAADTDMDAAIDTGVDWDAGFDSDDDWPWDGGQDDGGVVTVNDQCASADHDIELEPINMLIMLDRSRSMLRLVGDQTYAQVTAEALKSVVFSNEERAIVNFGLAAFPSPLCTCTDEVEAHHDSTYCADLDEVQCLPADATNAPLVDIGAGNALAIGNFLDEMGTCGGTPICKSLEWAHTYLKNLTASDSELAGYRTYILLATDGAPNCNPQGHAVENPETCTCAQPTTCNFDYQCLDDKCTYNQAMRLSDDGFRTFVIGVGEDVAGDTPWQEVMDNIAKYGGTGKYFEARDPAALTAALEKITTGLLPCNFAVKWDEVPSVSSSGVAVDKACNKVQVFAIPDLNNPDEKTELNYSSNCADPNGWHWQGLTHQIDPDAKDQTPLSQCAVIELCTGACQQLKNSTYERITFGFGCAPFVMVK